MTSARALLFAAACSLGCSPPPLEEPPAPPERTLGQKLYALGCQRLGASVLVEDPTGASYARICTPDDSGAYADTVDETRLVAPRTDRGREFRRLSVAKLHALARRRSDVIAALDATFPDDVVPVPGRPGETIESYEAVRALFEGLVELYDENPVDPGAEPEPLFPAATRSIGRFFAALGGSGDQAAAPASSAGATA